MNKKLNRIVSSMFVLLSATLLLSSCNVEEAFEGGLVGEDRVGVSAVGVDRSRDVVLRRVGVGLRDYALASQVAVLEQTGNLSDISGLAPGEITLNAGAFGTGVDVSGASEFISSAYCVDDDGLGYQVSYVSSRDGDGASFVRGLGRSQGASIAQGLLGDFSRGNLGVAGTNGKIALLNNASTTVPASCDADIPVGAAVIVLEGLSASAQFDEDESRIVYRSIDCIDTGFTGRILQQAVLRRDSDGNLSGGKTENGIVTQANIEGDLAATSASEEDVLEWIDVQQNCFEAGNNALVSSFADVTSVASQGVSDLSGANTALANATEIEIQCQGVLDGTALSSSEQAILTGDDAGARADLLAANPDLAQYQNCLGSEGQVELAEYQTSELGVMVCTGHPSLASFTPGNSIFPAIDADQFINPQHIIGIYTRDTLLPRGISSTGTNTSGEAEGTSSFFEWAVDCTWSEQLVISCGDIASVLGFDSSYQLTPASSSAITYTRQASVNSFAGSNVTQSETPPALGTITRSNVGAPSGTCIWERITNANGSCPIGETPAGGEPFITETETITVTSGINTPAPITTVTTSSTPECEAFNCTAPEFLNVSTNTCETCPAGEQPNADNTACETFTCDPAAGEIFNASTNTCDTCPSGQQPNAAGDGCEDETPPQAPSPCVGVCAIDGGSCGVSACTVLFNDGSVVEGQSTDGDICLCENTGIWQRTLTQSSCGFGITGADGLDGICNGPGNGCIEQRIDVYDVFCINPTTSQTVSNSFCISSEKPAEADIYSDAGCVSEPEFTWQQTGTHGTSPDIDEAFFSEACGFVNPGGCVGGCANLPFEALCTPGGTCDPSSRAGRLPCLLNQRSCDGSGGGLGNVGSSNGEQLRVTIWDRYECIPEGSSTFVPFGQ